MPNPLEGVDTSNEPYVIVSSDTHAGLQVEEYRAYLESRYHPQFDEWVVERHNHRRLVEEVNGEYVAQWEGDNAEGLRGAFDPEVRDKELDADGIAGEVIFADGDCGHRPGVAAVRRRPRRPGRSPTPPWPSPGPGPTTVGWWSSAPPTRPVAPAWRWCRSSTTSTESVREIESLAGTPGIKGIMIPTMWHDHPSYGHECYDPVWAACAEAGLVVHTHSGEGDWDSYNDNLAQFVLEVPFWTHRPLWQLLLSGKFDRFPDLKYVVVECGSYWLGDLLWKADTTFGGRTPR